MKKLVALPALSDNYIWMLHDGVQALVVDPGEATPVREALTRLNLRLSAILVTHHHPDHVGGLAELLPWLQGPIWGPTLNPLPVPVRQPEGPLTWADVRIEPLAVPGHTLGHLAYVLPEVALAGVSPVGHHTPINGPTRPLIFCGDTLFSAGCGRLFEGTPAQMHRSLSDLAALPDATLVCCTHEYTLANLRFALAVEPDNAAALAHQRCCEQLRATGCATLPTELALERQINPYLRCHEPTVVQAALTQGAPDGSPLSVFTALRHWKNHFK